MEFTSIITIIIVIVVAYYFFKFVISPLLRLIAGIILFFVIIYILQRFGIDFVKLLGPFGKYLDLSKLNMNLSGFVNLIGNYISRVVSFFQSAVNNIPKQ